MARFARYELREVRDADLHGGGRHAVLSSVLKVEVGEVEAAVQVDLAGDRHDAAGAGLRDEAAL